ncbi:MAG: alpha/beta hydrolase [Clostridia bacterium]|nr:alpha/beta hydrolase [Clostridia bacterium]
MNKKTFIAYDGKEIHYREWLPEGEKKGILQISHGMAEGIARYEKFAEFMADNGYIVIGDDHRAHGETDPGRTGYADGDIFYDTLKDMDMLGRIYKEQYPSLQLIIFGHSYGSFLTQRYIELYGKNVVGAILGGSAYMRSPAVPVGKIISRHNCNFNRSKKTATLLKKASFDMYNRKFKEGTFISSIKEECDIYNAHPDCNFDLSNAFYLYFFNGLSALYTKESYQNIDINKPILIISGKDDPVGSFGKSTTKLATFYRKKVGVKKVILKLYDGVRHEYLNDTSRADEYKTILDFCNGI